MKKALFFATTFIIPVPLLAQTSLKEPNVIYILADDLGYGDVSAMCNQSKIRTSNLDTLAQNGIRFTDCHSSSSLSTPTRYGILTGRYNWRSSLQSGVTWSFSEPLIERQRPTVATLLSEAGYNTAVIGKWHLGLGWRKVDGNVEYSKLDFSPNDNGFDYSFVMPASLDIPPYVYIRNGEFTALVSDTIAARAGLGFYREGPIAKDFDISNTLERFTDEAVDYIKNQSTAEKPFFLYFPLTAPHTPILPPAKFQGKSGIGDYGDFVLYVDHVVGRIVQSVKKAGIEENTIIIFTSDNGCSPWADISAMNKKGHNPSGGFRGTKSDIYDGGHRVPFIVQWKGVVNGGSECSTPISLVSLFATMSEIVGFELEHNVAEDSFSILPALKGENQPQEAIVHHSGDGYFALRVGKWKLVACPHSGGWSLPTLKEVKENDPMIQLYDMTQWPSEQENLSAQYPEIANEMLTQLKTIITSGATRIGAESKNDTDVVIFKNIKKNAPSNF